MTGTTQHKHPRRRDVSQHTLEEMSNRFLIGRLYQHNRPKARGGSWTDTVRMTDKGLENQQGTPYYFDEDGNLVNHSTGRKGHIVLDETYVTPLQTYTIDANGNKTIGRDPLRVFRNDKPLKPVYPEFALLMGLRQFNNAVNAYNTIKNTGIWLPKEVTKQEAKRKAKRQMIWDLINIFNPFFRNGGLVNYRPKARGGIGVTNDKGDNFYVTDDGTLVNERTGQRGSIGLPDITIRPRTYSSSFDGSVAGNLDVLNALTGGVLNRFSPTQNLRLAYDIANGRDWRSSWMGNNGLVSDTFAKKHPLATMLLNGAGDTGAAFGISKVGQYINGLSKLRGRTLSYTGVPPQNVYNFEHNSYNDYNTWTSNSPQYAKKYTIGTKGKGKIYKVYGNSTNPLKVPTADDNSVMWWENMPVHKTKDGKIALNSTIDYVKGKAEPYKISENRDVTYAVPDRFVTKIKQKLDPLYRGGMSTDEVVGFARENGHDATIFHNIDDGAGKGNTDDIINEIVFAPNSDIIKAPLTESRNATAYKIGNKYNVPNTTPISTSNIYRNNDKETTSNLRDLYDIFGIPYLFGFPINYMYK